MRVTAVVLFLLIVCFNKSYSQSCGCDKVINASSSYLVDGAAMNILPGDTVCLMAGTRSNMTFRYLSGTDAAPIVIINCGGVATINSNTSYGIKFEHSHHFKLTGTGSANFYGIEVLNTTNIGVFLGDFTTNFEIDHLYIHDIPFAGIMAKTDPVCTDTNTWRPNFTMRNVDLHHNYISNTNTGEGFYIGYSFYANGITCGNITAYPHDIVNIKVHHNRTYNTGCEGIQVGCAVKGCEIFNNTVDVFGQRPFNNSPAQQNGIQIGEGTGGLCYNNIVKAGTSTKGSNGIIVLGLGNNILYNNTVVGPGQSGYFVDERPPAIVKDTISGFWLINNTIINPAWDGIRTYAEIVNKNEFKNNIIIHPGTGNYISYTGAPNGIPTIIQGNNYLSPLITGPEFVYPDTNNFQLKATSPCIDVAENGAHWNIFVDQSGLVRPKGIAFDIGALEFNTTLQNSPPFVYAGKDTTIYSPLDSMNITGVATDSDGSIDSYSWSIVSPGAVKISQPGILNTRVTKLQKGTNTIRLTATDNGNKTSTDDLIITVLDKPVYIPTVFAGKDTTFNLPMNQLVLSGSVLDTTHSFTIYRWKQIQGPSTIIFSDSTSLSTNVSNFLVGDYVLRLSTSNGIGAVYYDDVTLHVLAKIIPPYVPTVSAGKDTSIYLPVSQFHFYGSVTDTSHSYTHYVWKQIHGPSLVIIQDSTSLTSQVSNFTLGDYVFRLLISNNLGSVYSDDIFVHVKDSTVYIPTISAGNDTSFYLPNNQFHFVGKVVDTSHTYTHYKWKQIQGPSLATIGDSTSLTSSVSNFSVGDYTFRLIVSNGSGASFFDDVVLHVLYNNPPVVNAGPDLVAKMKDSVVTLSGTASDQEGPLSSLLWTKTSGANVNILSPGNSTTQVKYFQPGTYSFRLTAVDNLGVAVSDSMVLVVSGLIVSNAGKDSVVSTLSNMTIVGSGSDSDGDAVTFLWTKVSGPSVTLSNTTTSSLLLSNLNYGIYTFQLKVTDTNGEFSTDQMVLRVNTPPVANAGKDSLVTVLTPMNIIGSGSDADGNAITYLWTKVSGPAITLSNTSSNTLSLSNLNYGVYTFRLTVTDSYGANSFDEMILKVNRAPIANAGQDVLVLTLSNTNIVGSGSDPDGDAITYLWTKVSGPSVTLSNTTTSTLSLSNLNYGVYTFRLKVTDVNGLFSTDDMVFKVNTPPVANAGPDVLVSVLTNTTITGSGSDADGDAITYLWTKVSGPAVTLSNINTSLLSLSNLVYGTYTFRLTVTDVNGVSSSDDMVFKANSIPVANAGPDILVSVLTNRTIAGSGSDADGDAITYLWTKVSGPAVTLSNTTTKTLSLSGLNYGVYTFRLKVTDVNGQFSTDDVVLTVNRPPVANAGATKSIKLGQGPITLVGTGTDSDGTVVSYSWTKVSGGAVTMTNANTPSLTISNYVAGNYVFQLTVTDNNGATGSSSVTVKVARK